VTVSNVYHTEPPTSGKVLLHTTYGDIDVELWSKETPKACRNFLQLAMEGVSVAANDGCYGTSRRTAMTGVLATSDAALLKTMHLHTVA
jgi:Cyclophilin type peptidyl-prolyl cis-trans isomerase/CLD